jgi:hypothetical protein
VQTVTTEEDGRFVFEQVPRGKYMLQGARRGYITSAYDEHDSYNTAIATGEGLDSENLVLRLTPDGVISGVVTDEAGEPVRQARLTLYGQNNREGTGIISQVANAMTDDTGAYELPHLRPGSYFLAATASPWYATRTSLIAANQDPNAPAAARSPLDVVYPTAYYSDATDSDSATPIPIKGGEDLQINFTLQPVPALHLLIHMPEPRGVVQGGGGPMFAIQHSVFGTMESLPEQLQFVGPGQLEIAGVPPGQYSLQISGGQDQPSRVLTLDASADQQIDATGGNLMATVSGAVQGGLPVAPGQQLLIGLVQPGKQNFQPVNSDGSFDFKDLAPGNYEVVAQGAGRMLGVERITATNASVEGHQLTVAADQQATITVTLIEGSVTVQGIAKRNGKPAAGAMIVLVPKNPETSRAMFRRDQSDSDGTFSLPSVAPGSYTVVAIQDGWSLDWAQSQVLARFLPKGEAITVPSESSSTRKLPLPVEVQPREPAN